MTVREPVREMPPINYVDTLAGGGGASPVPLDENNVTAQLDRMVKLEEEARKKGTMTLEDFEQVMKVACIWHGAQQDVH